MDWYKGITVAKDPDAVKDWQWDWSDWLGTGDSIASATGFPDTGITIDSLTAATGGVTVVLSGGTAGTSYDVAVQITTTNSLVDERTVTFEVSEQ